MKSYIESVPKPIIEALTTLEQGGFEAYLVGGCVRDLLIERVPKDWDITTNALPDQIIALFTRTVYENTFGTVMVINEEIEGQSLRQIEITPYRLEGKYSDNRHPDEVIFSKNLLDDLGRRDFTINALALNSKDEIIDPYNGQIDLYRGEVRSVGESIKRFEEDALRILRSVRLATELGFTINKETEKGIIETAHLLVNISKERIRDEFLKIVSCKTPEAGLNLIRRLNLMSFIVPELEETYNIGQNKAHSFAVWEHLLKTLQCAADKNWSLEIRLASLFHDIGKPRTRRKSDSTGEWTFYGHDVVSARMTDKILGDLKMPNKIIEIVVKLVRWHMFFSDTDEITLSAVRRLIVNVGKDYVWDLMNLRVCDRVGTGRPKENPYRLRKYKAMIDEALHDPISVGMLKINGNDISRITDSVPGPKIGHILHILLEEVLEDPKLNTKEYLEKKTVELFKLDETELKKIGKEAKEKKDIEEGKVIEEIRNKHFVK